MGIVGPYAMTKMFIDHEQYPIQCKLYLGLEHSIKDCPHFERCKVPHDIMTLNNEGNRTYEQRSAKQV